MIARQRMPFGPEQRSQCIAPRLILSHAAKRGHFRRQIIASEQHAQTMLIPEVDRRVCFFQLCPVLPDPKAAFAYFGIVKQHHGTVGQLGQPAFVVFLDVIIKVSAIKVQNVDRAIFDIIKRLGKGLAQQGAEPGIRPVLLLNGVEHLFAIAPGMFVALPGVNGDAAGGQSRFFYGLTKGKIGISVVRPQFDNLARPRRRDQPHCERTMAQPGSHRDVGRTGNLVPKENRLRHHSPMQSQPKRENLNTLPPARNARQVYTIPQTVAA
nr:hypothetical protein [Pseudotabrizicola alkalilacus]